MELEFSTRTEAAHWFARLVADDALPVSSPTAREGDEISLRLVVANEGVFGATARVVQTLPDGIALCTVQPRADFREFLARYALERRSGRPNAVGARRQHVRFDTCLRARFRSYQHLTTEYVANISRGGMFVRTDTPPPVGERLNVEVTLPEGQVYQVPSEVVWRVAPDGTTAHSGPAGVGVKFVSEGPFSAALESLLQTYLARQPRVLLVEDEPFFQRVMSEALMQRGVEVLVAATGLHAARYLVDCLYDLDVVVLDLNLPGVDGHALLERIRRLGGEMDLRVVVVSSKDDQHLRSLVRPGGADAAIHKGEAVDTIANRVVGIARGTV